MNTRAEIIEMLTQLLEDDEIFVKAIDELDAWNGYADGFRAFPMDELDELFYDTKLSDFLNMLTKNFDLNDDYFIDTIYGLESTNDKADVYRDNVEIDELIDELIENYSHINLVWIDEDLNDLIEQYIEIDEGGNEE